MTLPWPYLRQPGLLATMGSAAQRAGASAEATSLSLLHSVLARPPVVSARPSSGHLRRTLAWRSDALDYPCPRRCVVFAARDVQAAARGQWGPTGSMRWASTVSEHVPSIADENSDVCDLLQTIESAMWPTDERVVQLRRIERLLHSLCSQLGGHLCYYGSYGNGTWMRDSDLDLTWIVVRPDEADEARTGTTRYWELSLLRRLRDRVDAAAMCAVQKTWVVMARVPVLKIYGMHGDVLCDISVNNLEGLRNTRLVNALCAEETLLAPLVRLLKYWAQLRGIDDRSRGGFSTYTLVLMAAHFLQSRLPSAPGLSNSLAPEIVERIYGELDCATHGECVAFFEGSAGALSPLAGVCAATASRHGDSATRGPPLLQLLAFLGDFFMYFAEKVLAGDTKVVLRGGAPPAESTPLARRARIGIQAARRARLGIQTGARRNADAPSAPPESAPPTSAQAPSASPSGGTLTAARATASPRTASTTTAPPSRSTTAIATTSPKRSTCATASGSICADRTVFSIVDGVANSAVDAKADFAASLAAATAAASSAPTAHSASAASKWVASSATPLVACAATAADDAAAASVSLHIWSMRAAIAVAIRDVLPVTGFDVQRSTPDEWRKLSKELKRAADMVTERTATGLGQAALALFEVLPPPPSAPSPPTTPPPHLPASKKGTLRRRAARPVEQECAAPSTVSSPAPADFGDNGMLLNPVQVPTSITSAPAPPAPRNFDE
eukprot:CAMPEP_0117475744 /NCGR_PEP_ID=MMETSP0784-20121206/9954_1 /TAXON_ID=39447 /ORGANISM="" /LENGTH=728 /DNA_ID=CAMNT_0005270003 /DNA_START=1 /DNA_END=2184 /DNA_ORIENTATION=+